MNNNGSSRSEDDLQQGKQTVVSDALAKNSRQLLYAHLYNYLVENQLYDTARILLKEADVPLSNPLEKDGSSSENNEDDEDHDDTNHETSNEMNGIETDGDDALPGVKMLMTSPDTFLLEWWQSLWALHSYVKETPAIHHQQQQQQQQQQMNPAAAFNPYAANQFIPPQPIQAPVISNSNNSPIDSPASQQQQQQQAANNTTNTTNQQSLQSPLPQSAHGTPHPAQSITAPSPAPNANMIPVQQQQQPPGSAGPTHEHITPQMHHRTPVLPQQQQPQPQPVRQVPTPGSTNPNLPPSVVQQRQQQQQQQQPPQNQWQYNKMQQQLQAQELQQRVQMQKMQLNNQFNFQNLPPQQQQQFFLQQQQRLQAAQAAAAQANGGGARPNMPQQQIPQQAAAQAQFQQFQQQAGLPIQQQQTGGGGNIGSNAGTPTTQHPPQRANPPPPQSNDPNSGLRGDNSTALHDYQMQLMMLENQTKHLPPQAQPNMIPNQQQMMNMQLKNNAMKSRGESIGIDPLQPAVVTADPLINQQLMDLFNNNGGNGNNNGNNELNGGNTNPNQWQRNGSAGNLGIDELNVDLGVGFPNGGFMNGF